MSKQFVDIENYSYLLFGVIAIHHQMIDHTQLQEALTEQQQRPIDKIGSILLAKGFLTQYQLDKICQTQSQYAAKTPQEWKNIPDTVLKGLVYFPEIPLSQLTLEDILKAQQEQQLQPNKNLSQILVDLQIATQMDIQRLQNRIAIAPFQCNLCFRNFGLYNFDHNHRVLCPVCQRVLEPLKIRLDAVGLASESEFKTKQLKLKDAPQVTDHAIKEPPCQVKQRKLEATKALSPIENSAELQQKFQALYEDIDNRKSKQQQQQAQTSQNIVIVQQRQTKILRNVAMATAVLVMIFVVLLWREMPPRQPHGSIVFQEITPNFSQPSMDTIKILPGDPAGAMTKQICRQLLRDQSPTQAQLNQWIKMLYNEKVRMKDSPDLYNLLGRLFWYKIHLDKERIFGRKWLQRWQQEAMRSWRKAEDLYKQSKYQPNLQLVIKEWMPESKISRYQKSKSFGYQNPKDALVDLSELSKQISK